MTRFSLAGAAALAMIAGTALAQTTTESTTTTTVTPPPISAPAIVSTKMTNGRAVLPDGDQTASTATTWRDSNGETTTTSVTNQTYPLTNMITTTRKDLHTVNGVTTETLTTTQTYPPVVGRPDVAPVVTRTSRVIGPGEK